MLEQHDIMVQVTLVTDQLSTAEEVEALTSAYAGPEKLSLTLYASSDFIRMKTEQLGRVLLIDDRLKADQSLSLLQHAHERYPNSSVVMLTRKSDRQRAVESMKLGATDYLFRRDLNQDMFDRAMKHAIERSEQQRQIEQHNAVIDAFFDQAEEAMFLMTISGELVIYNSVYASFDSSLPGASKLEKKLLERLGETSFDSYLKKVGQRSEVVQFTSKDGEEVYWRIHLKRIAVQGRYARILGVITDITAEKRSTAEEQKAERLELTARMARILAHEVRNPLTNIRLSADYIQEAFHEHEELTAYSDIIDRNVTRIDDLIQRLLQSVRPFEVRKVAVPIASFAQSFKEKITDRQELLEADLLLDVDDTSSWLVDADKLELALLNLVSNAFEAMMHGVQPRLEIRFYSEPDAHCIAVSDNGKGMDEGEQSQLFEAFYTNRKGGMGLGMMMVQKIIEGHQGRILLHSVPKKGTRFDIRLPKL